MMAKFKVGIIDYGMGNLFSVAAICNHLNIDWEMIDDPDVLSRVDAAILPGVGAFGDAMESLTDLNFDQAIKEYISTGKQILGICLGMQLLFTQSDEFGNQVGLNVIPGKVKRLPKYSPANEISKVPNVSWCKITPGSRDLWDRSPLKNMTAENYMYFVHSYFSEPEDERYVLSYSEYNEFKFCSSVSYENINAFQFHPEKSGNPGIDIYKEWLKVANCHI